MRSRRWPVIAMIVLALAIGAGANAIEQQHLASGWHTVARGEPGRDLTVGNLQVHVHGAVASSTIDDDEPLTSPGTFVLVDLSYATTDSWFLPESPVLVDGEGREYTEPSGFSSAGGAWMAGPDVWYRGGLLFEVPTDVVDDLSIELRPENSQALLPSTVLRVPLTVSPSTEPLVLEYPTVLAEGDR